jgi:hypothetical protein
MLGMMSSFEILFALGATLILLVPFIAGTGIILYMIVRKAARDGAHDAAPGPDREPPA